MLTVQSTSKSYGAETILSQVSFSISSGERLGLVGPNGCGKTTLLRILAGQEHPDAGNFHISPPGVVGYLPQGLAPDSSDTIGSFLDRFTGYFQAMNEQLALVSTALAQTPDQQDLQHRYNELLVRLPQAAENAAQIPAVLAGLGLQTYSLDTPVAQLSGGQKTRLALAGVLLGGSSLLLLDEPTNHLDIDMLEWLEDRLVNPPPGATGRGPAVLLVSHDRLFIDRTVTGILELDGTTHTLKSYAGNYSDYLEQKLAERERQWQTYSDQQDEIARLRRAATERRDQARFRKGGKADTGDKFARGFFANRGRATMGRAKHLEKRLETLLNEEHIDKPQGSWQMKLDFNQSSPSGKDMLAFRDLAIGYDGTPLLEGLNGHIRQGARIALIGPNGAGKTTLLRTLAGRLPPLAGEVRLGSGVRIGYMAQEQELLDPALNPLDTLRVLAPLSETDARKFLHRFLFTGDGVFTPVASLSFGERARLALACLEASGCNLLLLDEPINYLDIPSRTRFEQALASFKGAILAVVHDRYFIEGFANTLWEIRAGTFSAGSRVSIEHL